MKLSWKTLEYLHKPKTNDWYWIVGIITISLALLSIILNNLIFGILIIVSAFTLSLFASKKPETIDVVIDDVGLKIGKTIYPYNNLESFWVEEGQGPAKLLVKSKKVFMPLISALIEEVEPEKVRESLKVHLPEEELGEPLLEKLLVYFGF